MPFGIGIGQVVGLVRETRGLESSTAQIAVSGVGAQDLAAALAAEGDPSAVSVDGDPRRAAVAIRLVEGEPSAAESAVLSRISRSGTPLIVVRRGGTERIPHVLAGDVLDAGTELPAGRRGGGCDRPGRARGRSGSGRPAAGASRGGHAAADRDDRTDERRNRGLTLAEGGPPAAAHARAEPHAVAARAQPWRRPSSRPAGAGGRCRACRLRVARPGSRCSRARPASAVPGPARQSRCRVRGHPGARRRRLRL